MFTELVLLFIALLLFYLLSSRIMSIRMRAKIGLCGPTPILLFGNLHQMSEIMKKNDCLFYSIFKMWKEQYGKLYGYFMGPKLFIVVEKFDLIEEILIKKFHCFTDRMEMRFLSDSLNSSIVNAKGNVWRHFRRNLSPVFTTAKLRNMSEIVHERLDIFLSTLSVSSDKGNCIEMFERFKALTLDVIARCAFAMQSNCQVDNQDLFLYHGKNYFNEMPSPESSILMRFAVLFPEIAPFLADLYKKTTSGGQSETWLHQELSEIIQYYRNRNKPLEESNVIKLLLERTNNSDQNNEKFLTRQQVSNCCFAFLLAGFETTSTALGFTTWLLAKHQDVQQTLFEELKSNLKNLKRNDYYDIVMRLPYLDAVFHESLRMFPPIVFFVLRTCVKKCEIGGININPGIQIAVPIWNIHYDEDIWSKPNDFMPERFYKSKKYHKMAWLPFGAGPRNCIGVRFATMEIKVTIARLILEYKVTLGSGSLDPLPLRNDSALLTTNRIDIHVQKR